MSQTMLKEIRSALPAKGALISLVGAGGKTTCIYHLSRSLISEGATVLVTTTTKIYHPAVDQPDRCRVLMGQPDHLLRYRPNQNGLIDVIAFAEAKTERKLIGFPGDQVDKMKALKRYDYILVEADGAKQKSIKAPADHEPVIPDATDLVIGLIGLTCLGLPLDLATVHRAAKLADISGQTPGSLITENTLIALIVSESGLFKGAPGHSRKIVVLNQADDPVLRQRGFAIGERVLRSGSVPFVIEQVMAGTLN
jgi:probable selenium-dependent hydroxylase accessory protein YqeC